MRRLFPLLTALLVCSAALASPLVVRAQAGEEDEEWDIDDDWMDEGEEQSGGQESGGEEPGGEESSGEESGGEEPGGEESGGEESGGEASGGGAPRDEETPPEVPKAAPAAPPAPSGDRERTPPGDYRALWAAHEVDAAEPSEFLRSGDPQYKMKQAIERLLGIHVVHPPWRHVSEQVEIAGSSVTVSYWYSISQDPAVVMCDALRWLSHGRNQWSEGVPGVFEEYEDVEQLTLHFINVERRRKGQVPGARDFRRYLSATVVRDGLDALAPAEVQEVITSGGSCDEYLRKHLKRFDFQTLYYERELRRGVEGQ